MGLADCAHYRGLAPSFSAFSSMRGGQHQAPHTVFTNHEEKISIYFDMAFCFNIYFLTFIFMYQECTLARSTLSASQCGFEYATSDTCPSYMSMPSSAKIVLLCSPTAGTASIRGPLASLDPEAAIPGGTRAGT